MYKALFPDATAFCCVLRHMITSPLSPLLSSSPLLIPLPSLSLSFWCLISSSLTLSVFCCGGFFLCFVLSLLLLLLPLVAASLLRCCCCSLLRCCCCVRCCVWCCVVAAFRGSCSLLCHDDDDDDDENGNGNGISWECQYHAEAISAQNYGPIFVVCTPECS